MPYKLLCGEFHIFNPANPRQGPEPDGDTIRFRPDNPLSAESIRRPSGAGPDFRPGGQLNLRLEGIDALETHFGGSRQNIRWAEAARDCLLELARFGETRFFEDLPNKVEFVENHPVRGHILARSADSHGRAIAFAFAGEPAPADGSEVHAELDLVAGSFNAELLRRGLVFPAFYTTLPVDLRDGLRRLAVEAHDAGRGLWPDDAGALDRFVEIVDQETLEELVLWPKLFRRLTSFFSSGRTHLSDFLCWLRQDPVERDDSVMLPGGELGNMHDLIEVEGSRLRLTRRVEDVVILPDDLAQPVQPCADFFAGPRGELRILAAVVNPAGPESGAERVTLLNIGTRAADLSGWKIADRNDRRDPLGGTLAAGDVLQVTLSSRVRLTNQGGTITLLDPADGIAHQVSYGAEQARAEGRTIVF